MRAAALQSGGCGSIFGESVVGIAVDPPLAPLRRGDDRMSAGASVMARMSVGRAVAAQRGAAGLTGAQVHPARPHLDARLAHALLRQLDLGQRLEVGTG